MKNYTVSVSSPEYQGSITFPLPERLAASGDTYEATTSFMTLGNRTYHRGDRFHVIDRTSSAPWKRSSSIGNLLIRCGDRTSVWTEFDAGIATGMFKLI